MIHRISLQVFLRTFEIDCQVENCFLCQTREKEIPVSGFAHKFLMRRGGRKFQFIYFFLFILFKECVFVDKEEKIVTERETYLWLECCKIVK